MADESPSGIDALAGDVIDYDDLFSKFRSAAGVDDRELALLAGLSSMMLVRDGGDGARFAPLIEFRDGSTSFTPNLLTDEDVAILRAVRTSNPALRARVADVLWELVTGRERIEQVHAAIDAYLEIAARADWYESEELLHRAISLALRFKGSDAGERQTRIHTYIRDAIDADAVDPGELLSLCELLRTVGAEPDDRDPVVAVLAAARAAAAVAKEYGLERNLIGELLPWTEDEGDRHDLTSQVAQLWVAEADSRLQGPQASAFVAASFLESAIQVLRSIPRKHRDRLDVATRIGQLRTRMRDLNEAAIEEMVAIDSPSFTVQGMSEQARTAVSGHSVLEGLLRFTRLVPWASEPEDRTAAEKILEGTITAIIPETSLTGDGRVADKSDADDAVDRQMGHDAQLHRHIVTIGLILPALRALRAEHTLSREMFLQITHASAVVPPGHENLFASGLWAGWNYDFGVSVHVLTPRIEALMRHHLNAAGVPTTHLDGDGTEDEISLPALLDKPEAGDVFGGHILYELQSLYAGRFGSNLRHNIAHGLVDDSIRRSIVAVYAWWSTLRLVMVPFWNRMTSAAQPASDGPDLDESDSDEK
ncbi:DUF4209 domain-containing protein [Microbacterium sp. 2FI]|uniref:DUF4209 domain-containing protein n=1 Tax=Microbacterium sp. 2FI TaxID=2502193 RepID=UPI0010F57CB4|nr:DUF4209 domain-containing protein [Microbacterium sp. 2FI]